jgi:hypothetical protein
VREEVVLGHVAAVGARHRCERRVGLERPQSRMAAIAVDEIEQAGFGFGHRHRRGFGSGVRRRRQRALARRAHQTLVRRHRVGFAGVQAAQPEDARAHVVAAHDLDLILAGSVIEADPGAEEARVGGEIVERRDGAARPRQQHFGVAKRGVDLAFEDHTIARQDRLRERREADGALRQQHDDVGGVVAEDETAVLAARHDGGGDVSVETALAPGELLETALHALGEDVHLGGGSAAVEHVREGVQHADLRERLAQELVRLDFDAGGAHLTELARGAAQRFFALQLEAPALARR